MKREKEKEKEQLNQCPIEKTSKNFISLQHN